jgi:hypothetical protein
MQNVPNIVRERLKAAPSAVNHPDADVLTAFAEQSLPDSERALVLDHLARCGDCRDVLALALPATETLETAIRPTRSTWMTWPALRWGFVAAGILVIASFGILKYQQHPAPAMMASKSPSLDDLKATAPKNEVEKPVPALTAQAPVQKAQKSDALPPSAVRAVNGVVAANEPKQTPPAASPASAAHAFGSFGGNMGGPVVSGPKPPSQFQFNNNAQQQQQQVSNNAGPVPAMNQPVFDQSASAKQSSPGGSTATVEVVGEAPMLNTETSTVQTKSHDQSTPALARGANPVRVDKAKLPDSPAVGQIYGYVVDPTGAVLPNARITLTPIGNSGTATAVSNSQGAWRIGGIPSGDYKVQAEMPGFQTTVRAFSFDARRPSLYSLTLSPGSVSESVAVSSAAPQADTSVANTVTDNQLSQLPINGRSVSSLSAPSAGQQVRWTISSTGTLQRSFDQGNSWQNVDVNASAAYSSSLQIVDEGPLSREKDTNKKALKRQPATPFFRAVAASGANVWAGGSAGALYHSSDAGNTWTRVIPTSAGSILSGDVVAVDFPDPQHGAIKTSAPETWTTTDSGQSWQKQ